MVDDGKRFCALVAAAGSGVRMRSSVRKPFLCLDSIPLLYHTLARLRACKGCLEMIIAVHPDDFDGIKENRLATLRKHFDVTAVIPGGDSRQQTVDKMLKHVPPGRELILIHDGVRPLVRPDTVEKVTNAAVLSSGGAVAAVPANETVKEVDSSGTVTSTLRRCSLWMVQTPQVFHTEALRTAYTQAARRGRQATDDAALVEAAGYEVVVVTGSRDNIKVTVAQDLTVAQALLAKQIAEGVFDNSILSKIPREGMHQ